MNREVDVTAPSWQVWSTIPGGYVAYSALLYDKFRMRTQQVVTPGMLFTMLGIDDTTSASLTTFYPNIPHKQDSEWIFPEFRVGMPDIARAGQKKTTINQLGA
ncbi:uncharacterized protein ACA1_342890 [Acanthamoeba castellanii str. Neff]|uniref:Uncharacterized protein n=1 Tax=Acanthamoeba castellanii (strain ATCC 30010 / Neff) TaxID=1257118 RepID=L8HDB0_ACACF|nr:uncharacterized protein ACA1_342890 [Acanthamoeba castellanii str. Neff]ELR23155.1 hypothetical protein ACA1_342890 [Acanthamoeba castellanii str. Neff]